MSDSGQPSATGETLPEWRRTLQESIGEDPACYLDRDLASGNGRDLALARIRGLARIDVVRAWVAAERRLADRDGREPRGKILDLLEEREADLQEHGERPRDLRAALEDDARSVPERYWPSRGAFDPDQDSDEKRDLSEYPPIRERFSQRLATNPPEPLGSPSIEAGGITADSPSTFDGIDEAATDGGSEGSQ